MKRLAYSWIGMFHIAVIAMSEHLPISTTSASMQNQTYFSDLLFSRQLCAWRQSGRMTSEAYEQGNAQAQTAKPC